MSDTQTSTETVDPGHTPGSAEGTPDPADQSKREPGESNATPDQAEGELEDAPQ
jgi:hypothetical protein